MTVHGYEIVDTIGEGGMGTVHRAVHRPSGREVAIKTVRDAVAGDSLRRRLLLDEATAAARLRHPAIVEMLDVGEDDHGRPFLVMELVEGTDLGHLVRGWPGWNAIVRVLDDTLAGLGAAHAAGIIHRDLKPDNVLVDARGRGKIADFGVACVLDPLDTRASKRSGVAGTPAYMPPEQLGNDLVGPYTDLYAFGVVLHELLSGQSPFAQSSFTELFARKREAPPPLVCRPGLDVPAALEQLVRDLLRPHPRERPRFACEVRAILAELAPQVGDRISWTAPAPLGAVEENPTVSSSPRADTSPNAQSSLVLALAPTEAPRSARSEPRPVRTDAATIPFDEHPEWRQPTQPSLPPLSKFLPAGADARPGASLQRLREPELVGRADERATIGRARDAVVAGEGVRMVLLRGGAGVGKSRLARWALADVETHGTMEAVAAAYDPGGARIGGLREAIHRLVGSPGRGTEGPIAEWAWLYQAGASPEDLAHVATWLLQRDDERTPAVQAATAAWRALRAASRVRPVLLWLDDVAWAQDGALELLELLAERPEPDVLVVATMREGTAQHPRVAARLDSLASRRRVVSHRVAPLGPEDVVQLIDAIVPLEPEVAHALAPALDGTPLVAVQLLHDWLDAGMLVAGPTAFRLREGESVEHLLATRPIESILARRLAGVLAAFGSSSDVAEWVLHRAALLGSRFQRRALVASTRTRPDLLAFVDAVLDRSLLHGVLRAEGRGKYRFDHGKLHEALVSRVEARGGPEVAQAARDTAEAVLATYPTELPEVMVQAALLFRRAGDRARALELWTQATISAGHVGDDAEAQRLLAIAWEWVHADALPDPDPRRAAVQLAAAYVHYYGLRYPEALEAIGRAAAMHRALDDVPGQITDQILEAAVLFHMTRYRESQRTVLQLAADRYRALQPKDHLRLCHRLSELAMVAENNDAALKYAVEAHDWAKKVGLPWRVDLASLNLAELHLARGEIDAATALLSPLVDSDEHGQPRLLQGEMAESKARLAYARGDAAEAREILSPRVRKVEMLGDRWRLTALRQLEALIAVQLDPPDAAAAAAHAFVAAFRDVPHDEAFTMMGMDRLVRELDALGEREAAAAVRAIRAERRAQYARGWREE